MRVWELQTKGEKDMKKVLILSGSPRMHGNSNILCDEFARGATEAGYEIEKINVSRMKVAGCLGCNACYKNGGTCVQKDEMEQIREKMIATDVIVLASPIYFYSMTAQLKAVIDRTYAFYQELAGKTFYFIISCAAPEASFTETMTAALRGFTCCVPEAKEGGVVLGMNTNEPGDVKTTEAMQQAYEMGKAIGL